MAYIATVFVGQIEINKYYNLTFIIAIWREFIIIYSGIRLIQNSSCKLIHV